MDASNGGLRMNPFISAALFSLRPGAQYSIVNEDYSTLQWLEKPVWEGGQKKPTKEEVENEALRLQKEWENTEYQRLRAKEYPDFKEYLDGIVKGDQEQMQAYIDKCLAVKAKYPKPEGVE
jgi:hypothetical protein